MVEEGAARGVEAVRNGRHHIMDKINLSHELRSERANERSGARKQSVRTKEWPSTQRVFSSIILLTVQRRSRVIDVS